MSRPWMRRWGAIGPAMVLVLAACGSGGGAGSSTAASSTGAGGTSSNPPAALPSTGGGDNGGVGAFGDASFAVVVFEGERYEWSDLHCYSFGGGVGGQSLTGDPSIWLQLPASGAAGDPDFEGEPPALQVKFGTDDDEDVADWVAGGAVNGVTEELRAAGGIDEWTIEETQGTDGQYDFDHRATGTATFVNRTHYGEVMNALLAEDFNASPPPEAFVYATGTFEFTCV